MQKKGTLDKRETRIRTKALPDTPKPSYRGATVWGLYLSTRRAPTRTPPSLSAETSQQRETNDFPAGCKPELAPLAGDRGVLRYLTATGLPRGGSSRQRREGTVTKWVTGRTRGAGSARGGEEREGEEDAARAGGP